jgi:hypothetical protein
MLLVHAAQDLVGGELLSERYCPVPGYVEGEAAHRRD